MAIYVGLGCLVAGGAIVWLFHAKIAKAVAAVQADVTAIKNNLAAIKAKLP